jgi:hypothetical protein
MMDLSSFMDGAMALLGMAAIFMMAGWTLTSLSSTVSAPENSSQDDRARQLKKAA